MKKTVILFVIISIGFSKINAQTARGYLGKKNAISANFGAFPAWFDFLQYDKPLKQPINTKWQLNYQRAVSEKVAVGAHAAFYTNDFPAETNIVIGNNYENLIWTGNEPHFVSSNEFGILINFYSRNDAPLGRYRGLRLSYITYSYEVDMAQYRTPNGGRPYEDIGLYSNSENAVRLSFVFGSTRIVKNKFIIDYGFEIGLLLDPISSFEYAFLSDIDNNYYEVETVTDIIDDRAAGGVFTNGFLMINLGLGYIW